MRKRGCPIAIHDLDHTAGELDGPAHSRISCFHQLPVIDDDGVIVAESGAVLLYLAEKAGKLIPGDFEGRMRVVQWCFAALTTVERPLMEIQVIDKFGGGEGAENRRAEMVKEAGRWFDGLERRLDGREWIACADFTVADILLATVLRDIRTTDLIDPYPRLTGLLRAGLGASGLAAHPQPLRRAARRDRRGHSLRIRTVEIAPPNNSFKPNLNLPRKSRHLDLTREEVSDAKSGAEEN